MPFMDTKRRVWPPAVTSPAIFPMPEKTARFAARVERQRRQPLPPRRAAARHGSSGWPRSATGSPRMKRRRASWDAWEASGPCPRPSATSATALVRPAARPRHRRRSAPLPWRRRRRRPARSASATGFCVRPDARQHGRTLARRRCDIELVGLAADRTQARPGQCRRSTRRRAGSRHVANAGPAVDRDQFEPGHGGSRQLPDQQLTAAAMTHQVGRQLGRDQRSAADVVAAKTDCPRLPFDLRRAPAT